MEIFAKYGMALFLSLLLAASLPNGAAAQNGNGGGGGDPVCWWCVEDYKGKCTEYDPEFGCIEWTLYTFHYFTVGGKFCPPGGGGGGTMAYGNGNGGGSGCRACGGESLCHTSDPAQWPPEWEPEDWPEGVMGGPCHVSANCPGGEELGFALLDLRETLQTADANGIARLLRTVSSFQLFPDAGSIRTRPECGVLHSYPIPAGLAAEVAALLGE